MIKDENIIGLTSCCLVNTKYALATSKMSVYIIKLLKMVMSEIVMSAPNNSIV